MSGLGAPARTAMPMLDWASGTPLSPETRPPLISSRRTVSATMTTSTGSLRCSRFGIELAPVPTDVAEATTLFPEARSNCGTSSRNAAVKARGHDDDVACHGCSLLYAPILKVVKTTKSRCRAAFIPRSKNPSDMPEDRKPASYNIR
jgi:hypothetical protein